MSDSEKKSDRLDCLAAQFLEAQRLGACPSITDYAAAHPELADDIRELFPLIASLERLKARNEQSGSGLATLGPTKLERLGDFRIVRELGRGGMGIAYEAEQESLGRSVAIKVLPRQALLDRKHLSRFQREARIAAGLHHTNIVQVFGVGEQEGFHYIVMQLIRGVGLDRIIAQLRQTCAESARPVDAAAFDEAVERLLDRAKSGAKERPPSSAGASYWQRVAAIGVQVAGALDYAHGQGTLHRDIKPANLLLDDQEVVWVTDFGLAKAMEGVDVSRTGEITGTLRYMAPEQFGGRADARSDIYSLGLTLYELLTLRPAYDDLDRASLIRRITLDRPTRPRRLNARIPRDLETIVLKAIAREPDRRYRSAAVLEADLRCFVEDRPIRARRISAIERGWRWCRRNKITATLGLATLFLIVAVALVATVGYVRTRTALEGEAWQRKQAEANARLASDALDRIFERFAPRQTPTVMELMLGGQGSTTVEIADTPVLSKEVVSLLEELLAFYDQLARQVEDDVELRQKSAAANRRVGDICQHLGQYDRAIAAYEAALDIYQQQRDGALPDDPLGMEIVRIQNAIGSTYRAAREPDKARGAHAHALAMIEAASAESPESPEVDFERARTYYFLGVRERPEPGVNPPGPGGPRGMAGPRPFPGPPPPPRGDEEAFPPGPPPPHPVSQGSERPPSDPSQHVRPQDASLGNGREQALYLDQAVALLDRLVEQHPDNPDYRHWLALCHRERFPALVGKESPEAVAALDRATEILEGLVEDFPNAPYYRHDLSETYAMPDVRHPRPPGLSYADVVKRLVKAEALAERLVAEHPYVPGYMESQAHILHKIGSLQMRARRLREARENLRKAVALQLSLVSQFPHVESYTLWLGVFSNELARAYLRDGRLREAKALLEDSTTRLADLLEREPERWYINGILAENHDTLAEVLRVSGDAQAASDAAERAQTYRQKVRSLRIDASQNAGASPDGARSPRR